ncbi:MAG TPA: hypothetical protein VF006_14290 [Longimicrobium sp.]
MKPLRIPALLRALIAALAILLAGCDDGPTTPGSLTGSWLAVLEQGAGATATRVEDRLELTNDGRFVWTTVAFGAEGRSQDGMVAWFSSSGDWGVEGDRLALRTLNGMSWEHGRGWSQADYAQEWIRAHRLRMESGRMVLVELPPPERSLSPRTFVFQRTVSAFDGPQP